MGNQMSEKDKAADDVIQALADQCSKLGKIIMKYREVFASLYDLVHKPVIMISTDQFSRIEVMQIDKEEYERWQKVKAIIRDTWSSN